MSLFVGSYGKACAVVVFMAAFAGEACMTFVVGRKASATGHVIVGHNEDDREPIYLKHAVLPARDWAPGDVLPATEGCARVPQVPHTLATYWSEAKFAHGDNNADLFFNERGVLIVSNSGGASRERMDDPSLLTEGGVKFNLRRIVGERATSARDAVRLIGELVTRYGYAPSARIYTVADRDEAWMVQVVHGHHYVAVRCPDDQVSIMPNLYTVHGLADWPRGDVVTSPGLVENARAKGFWDGTGVFDFAEAYQGARNWGPRKTFTHPSNDGRFPLALRLLTGRPWPADRRWPFSVAPATGTCGVDSVKTLLTAHNDPPVEGIHVRGSWGICQVYTVESTVCAFGETPAETELHVACGRPCENPYRVFRPFGEGLPADFDDSADAAERLACHVRPFPASPSRRGVDRALLDGLLRRPSVSGHEAALLDVVDFTRSWLVAHGVHCVVETNDAGRVALYAATKPTKTPDYLLVSHLDVVPAPDWMFDPTYADGRVYARGACDTKGNVALCCQLLANLKDRASVGLFLATDEEGGARGQKTPLMMIARGYLPTRMALVFDSAGSTRLFVAEKGHAHVVLTARGRGGHSSRPWALDNPIPKLFKDYLSFSEAWEREHASETNTWRTVLSPTMVKGSDANNIVPDEASLSLSCRYVSMADLDRVRGLLKEHTTCDIEIDPGVRPVENRADDPEIFRLLAAMDSRIDGGMKPARMDAATHAAYYAGRGFPVVILSAEGDAPHCDREWGSLKSLDEYLNFFTEYLRQGHEH